MPDEQQPNLEAFEAESRDGMSKAQKRLNLFLLHRHPELTPPDVRLVETVPADIDDAAIDEAAQRVADGAESASDFLVAARAREISAGIAKWRTIVHEAAVLSDVREIDPESGENVT